MDCDVKVLVLVCSKPKPSVLYAIEFKCNAMLMLSNYCYLICKVYYTSISILVEIKFSQNYQKPKIIELAYILYDKLYIKEQFITVKEYTTNSSLFT